MGENDLVVAIHRVLHVLGVLHVHRSALVFEISSSGRIEIHGAEGRGGDIDVIDMVKHHWLVRVGQGKVLLCFLWHQGLSAVADDLLDEARVGEL